MPVVVPSGSTPAPIRDAWSLDQRVRAVDDPSYGGVRVKLDYSWDLATWSSPFRCTVYRVEPGGSTYTVRGGDPYMNYAGKGWLYDQEAPLGAPVSYYAVPVNADGTTGPQSAAAAITTTAPAGGFAAPDMWLVNLEDPSASIQARGASSLAGTYNGRNDKQTILGSPYPAVTFDSRNGLGTQISVLTVGQTEFAAMQKLLSQNVIMRKSSLWERPNGYFTVDDVSYAAQAAGTGRGVYLWQLNLTEVRRPSTYGQTVASPRYSYGAYTTQYPLFSGVPGTTYDSVQGGNLLDTNTSGMETSVTSSTGWSVYNSNSTIAQSSAQAYRGTYSLRITATATGVFGAYTQPRYPATQGTVYTFSIWAYSTVGPVVDLQIDWKNGAGTYLSSDSLGAIGQTVPITANAWTQVFLSVTPPAGAALFTPVVKATATASGQQLYVDAVSVENSV